MAHWLAPPNAPPVPSNGYDVDNKLAPGSLWRMHPDWAVNFRHRESALAVK